MNNRRMSNSTLNQYVFIVDYIDKHGYAPSIREMQEYMQFSSISSAYRHFSKLLDCGLLETDFDDNKSHPRAYRLARTHTEIFNERT